jgi:hypothetical protein
MDQDSGAVFLDFDHPADFLKLDQRLPPSSLKGRNFGFLSDEQEDLPRVVVWPSQPLTAIPRVASDPTPLSIWGNASVRDRGRRGEVLHGNGSPIRLPREYNNSILMLTHSHQDISDLYPPPTESEKMHMPHWGIKYTSTWLLAEGASPFHVMAQSPAFCLPSFQDASRCETIQFVTTLILVNDEELLLGYVTHWLLSISLRFASLVHCQRVHVVPGGGGTQTVQCSSESCLI